MHQSTRIRAGYEIFIALRREMIQRTRGLPVLSVAVLITVWFCKQFYDKGVDGRWQIANERKLCFRCLASDHRAKDCTYVESMVALEIITAFFMEVKCWQKPD